MADYLYISASCDGWRNLALDEYFLDRLTPQDRLLYFYINANAVIIGCSQNPWVECDLEKMQRDGVQLVRRITGGGAVYHDGGNLNFSFIMGKERYDVSRQLDMILAAVRALGIPCDFSGRNDLLTDGRKFSGNAFCARREMRQHHGTLLVDSDLARLGNYLTVDPRKLQAKGVKSVRSRVCNLRDFVPGLKVEDVLAALITAYGADCGEYICLTDNDLDEKALAPYYEKHSGALWRLGATPRFDAQIENRFAWGNVQVDLTLRHGAVDEVRVYSDAIDAELAPEIVRLLRGVEYDHEKMATALEGSARAQIREFAQYLKTL